MIEFSPSNCSNTLESLRSAFKTGKTRSYEFRIKNLHGIKKFLKEKEAEISAALTEDLGRPHLENVGLELATLDNEINYIIKNLKSWMQPIYTSKSSVIAGSTCYYVHEPFGVTLIIGPFNYPLILSLSPLIGAICAGNCSVVKPSELTPACEKLLSKYIPLYIDNDCFKVVCGGVETTKALLNLKWDKIFFTGSTRVGKIVMKAAAEHLTPVSLELGGKSPVIIDESVTDIDLVARRIVWGKCINAGQTCIAPDYILCHSKHYESFLKSAKKAITNFYGENPENSPDLSRIATTAHTERLKNLLKGQEDKIVIGGNVDVTNRYVSPTIIRDVEIDSKIMQEEIFGPVLPCIKVDDMTSIVDIINHNEKPLVLYIFSKNQSLIDEAKDKIQSGDVVINDTIFHFANMELPFGGISSSGMGSYHGKFSFETFSHQRSFVHQDDHGILDIYLRYPPYSDFALKVLKTSVKIAVPHFSRYFIGYTSVAIAALAYLSYKFYVK